MKPEKPIAINNKPSTDRPFTDILGSKRIRNRIPEGLVRIRETGRTLRQGSLTSLQARGVSLGHPPRTENVLRNIGNIRLKSESAKRTRRVIFGDHALMAAEGTLFENGVISEDKEIAPEDISPNRPRKINNRPDPAFAARELLTSAKERMRKMHEKGILGDSGGILGTLFSKDRAVFGDEGLVIIPPSRDINEKINIPLSRISDGTVNVDFLERDPTKRNTGILATLKRLLGGDRGTITIEDRVTKERFVLMNVLNPENVVTQIGRAALEQSQAQRELRDIEK